LDEIAAIAQGYVNSGVTEVHIVGGVHPDHTLDYYVAMISRIRAVLPNVAIKAFSAIELIHTIEKAGKSYAEGLALLKEAGMSAIPGGGAEIFDEAVRKQICPDKSDADKWLALHRDAHKLGINSNATMLYGHIETIAQRIDHLQRLRDLQDTTGGFDAFIPLKYRRTGNRLGEGRAESPVTDDMRTLAMSRIFLDNVPHIKAYWVMYGKAAAEMALAFGADDMDGTIDNTTKIFSMAGSEEQSPRLTVPEITRMAASAGLRATERDTFYNEI
jgi:aminodeoxyfutalosine synthase